MSESISLHLAWALLHFLWQGALLGMVAWVALHLVRHQSPQLRYGVACLFLFTCLLLPLLGLLWQGKAPIFEPQAAFSASFRLLMGFRRALAPLISAVLPLWLLGALGMALRALGCLYWLQRLRNRAARVLNPHGLAALSRLRTRFAITRRVELLESPRVRSPFTTGLLRPVVFLPLGFFASLDPLAAEAVLAHELAHIRRLDVFVIGLQTLVETLLFYHPVIWWLSRRVHAERECCCDDWAVRACGDPILFAQTLQRLDELREAIPALAPGAGGGDLVERIKRLLNMEPGPLRMTAPALALTVALAGTAMLAQQVPVQNLVRGLGSVATLFQAGNHEVQGALQAMAQPMPIADKEPPPALRSTAIDLAQLELPAAPAPQPLALPAPPNPSAVKTVDEASVKAEDTTKVEPGSGIRQDPRSDVGAEQIAAAQQPWLEVRSTHFIVKSDAPAWKARRVAASLENLREMFHHDFPNLKLDGPAPLVVFAMDGEASLRQLLPWYWEGRDGLQPFARFLGRGQDHQDYLAVRADIGDFGNQTHESTFHLGAFSTNREYTRAIYRLNSRQLPLWLEQGLAEYFGSTVFEYSSISVGRSNRFSLARLSAANFFHWMPLEQLLKTDENSPAATESVPADYFNVECGLLVHYLYHDPQAVKRQLLQKYFQAWQKSGDATLAAKESLGDLVQLKLELEVYSRRNVHGYQRLATLAGDPFKGLQTRPLSEGEVLAAQGALLVALNRPTQAEPLLRKAAQIAPQLSTVHAALGSLARSQHQAKVALEEFQEATRLDGQNYLPAFYLGQELLAGGAPSGASQALPCLEAAVRLNAQFAPAYDALASARMLMPEKRNLAAAAATRACELDPLNLEYLAHLGRIFLAQGQRPEAEAVAARLARAAYTAQDRDLVEAYKANMTATGAK